LRGKKKSLILILKHAFHLILNTKKVKFRLTLFGSKLNLKTKTKFKQTTFIIEPKSFSLGVGFFANRVKIVLKASLKVKPIPIFRLGLCHTRGWFHQSFTSSFCVRRSQKRKKDTDDLTVFFTLWGSAHIKALSKHVGEIDPWRQS